MPREKSAGAIIFRMENGVPHYLLLHYFSGHWEFPKGHVEVGETEEETVKREIFEETGINDLRIVPGFKKYIKYFFRQYKKKVLGKGPVITLKSLKNEKTPWVFKLVTFFLAETKIEEVKISPEHSGFLWLPIDEAIKKTTFKNSKKLLKEADDYLLRK